MRPAARTLIWTFGVLASLAVLLVAAGFFLRVRFGGGGDGALEVWTQPVERGLLVETVSAPGEVRPITQIELSARVSARVRALPFREGEAVAAGDVLVELDDTDLKAQLDAAAQRRDGLVASIAVEEARIRGLEASLSSTRSAEEEAKRDLERQAALEDAGDVSSRTLEQARQAATAAGAATASEESALEAAELNLSVTRFNIASADADIRRFEDNLAYTTMRSPIDGVLTRVNVEVGEVAVTGTMNNPGTVLLEVADLSGLLVVARVDEADVSDVAVGQPAEARLPAFADRVFAGVVERVALATPAAASSSTAGLGAAAPSYETRILLSELPDPVRTGLSATVEIEAARFEGVLLVPSQSVFSVPRESVPEDRRGDVPVKAYTVGGQRTALVVYAVVDGKTRLLPVEIGASDAENTVLAAGVDEGMAVVTGPFTAFESLADALAVEVVSSERDSGPLLGEKAEPRRGPPR